MKELLADRRVWMATAVLLLALLALADPAHACIQVMFPVIGSPC